MRWSKIGTHWCVVVPWIATSIVAGLVVRLWLWTTKELLSEVVGSGLLLRFHLLGSPVTGPCSLWSRPFSSHSSLWLLNWDIVPPWVDISNLLRLCRANRCVCDDGAHCWIGAHVSCSICHRDSHRAPFCFLSWGSSWLTTLPVVLTTPRRVLPFLLPLSPPSFPLLAGPALIPYDWDVVAAGLLIYFFVGLVFASVIAEFSLRSTDTVARLRVALLPFCWFLLSIMAVLCLRARGLWVIFIIAIPLGVRVTHAPALANMDMKSLQTKLGLSDQVRVVRKAQELVRLSNVHFNSSSFGVVCTPSILALWILNVNCVPHCFISSAWGFRGCAY